MEKSLVSWQGKRVLVTGAGGFIGSHLCERLLAEGALVRALVHYNALGSRGWLDTVQGGPDLEVVSGDVADGVWLTQAMTGCQVVFHLAALIGIPYSYQAPDSYVRTNVQGTLNVLQAARACSLERVVHTSTSEVYGSARYVPIDEKHPLQAQSPYAATKIAADKLAESFACSFELPVVTVRPFNTFGPRQSARAVVPAIITQALTRNEIRLGDTWPTRDLNFVADTVSGFLRAGEAPGAVGQVINLGSGRDVSIGDLAATILRIMGCSLPIVGDAARVRPRGSEVERLCAENHKAREILGWQPQHTLEDGLRKTIPWLERNLDRYRTGGYVV